MRFSRMPLCWTEELKVKDIIPSSADMTAVEEHLEEAKGTLADLNHKIGKTKTRLLGDGDFDALADVLRTLDNRKKETEAMIERLTTELQSERDTSLANAKHLIRELNEVPSGERKEELRTRLKARIADLVEKIRMTAKVHRPPNKKRSHGYRRSPVLRGQNPHLWARGEEQIPPPSPGDQPARGWGSGRFDQ